MSRVGTASKGDTTGTSLVVVTVVELMKPNALAAPVLLALVESAVVGTTLIFAGCVLVGVVVVWVVDNNMLSKSASLTALSVVSSSLALAEEVVIVVGINTSAVAVRVALVLAEGVEVGIFDLVLAVSAGVRLMLLVPTVGLAAVVDTGATCATLAATELLLTFSPAVVLLLTLLLVPTTLSVLTTLFSPLLTVVLSPPLVGRASRSKISSISLIV